MRRFSLRCANGHEFGLWPHEPPRENFPCDCGAATELIEHPWLNPPSVRPDMATGYSDTFGCVVNGRRHFERLQRDHGTSDYAPLADKDAGLHRAWKDRDHHDAATEAERVGT